MTIAPKGSEVWVGMIEWDSSETPSVALFRDPGSLLVWTCKLLADVTGPEHEAHCDCGGEFDLPLPQEIPVADRIYDVGASVGTIAEVTIHGVTIRETEGDQEQGGKGYLNDFDYLADYLDRLEAWHDEFHDAHTVPWATIPTGPEQVL